MQLTYNNKQYEIIIEKKRSTRNTYIRVKPDLKIYISTNIFASNRGIEELIIDRYDKICDMIDYQEKKAKNNNGFFYLGKQYVIVYTDNKKIEIIDNKIYVPHDFDIDKWYKKQAESIFKERFDYNCNNFSRYIPTPKLRIRKMKSRWGVCNIKTHIVTINLELIKRDTCYLDYVIIHELSHLVYGDHSNRFWRLVGENMPDYKKYKEEMKEF